MNIPDKKTDLEDNRNARSFLKTRIQTESAGFFNGLLKQPGRYLEVPRPDIILLDLNMLRKNGFEVLTEVKTDPDFKSIPTLIYTSSVVKEDIRDAYNSYANGYIRKSVDFDDCIKMAKSIKDFWFSASLFYEP